MLTKKRYEEYAIWLNKKNRRVSVMTQLQLLAKRLTKLNGYTNNILTKERLVNFLSSRQLIVQYGTVYGFAYEGKIYLNPDTINSNAAVHEYTHLWDNYTMQTNPKLWNKGKKILSKTHLWNEVKNDPNYKDIAQDDDLVLSEVHARICGDMAQKVLERMAQEDGKLTKDSAIEWDREAWKYIRDVFAPAEGIDIKNNLEASIDWADIYSAFIATPMQDLMSGKNITIDEMNLQQAPEKKNNMSFEKGIDMFVALNKKAVQIEAGTKFNFEADGMKYINADYKGIGEVSGFIAFNIDGEIKNIPYGQIKNITLTEEPARAIEKTEAESFAQKVKNDDFLRDHIVISGVPRTQNEIHIKPSVQDRNTGKAWGVNPGTGKMEELKNTENGWVLDESKKNMHPSIDNHDKTSHYNIEESLTKQGAENEGKESSAVQVREGDDDRTQDGRGNNGRDVEQHDNRLSAEMGGAGSGLNGGGAGHGDSVHSAEEAVGREDLRHAPDDNSPSGGSIQSAGENHDTAGGGLHGSGMQQGALGDDIREPSSGADTAGHGDVGRTQGLKGKVNRLFFLDNRMTKCKNNIKEVTLIFVLISGKYITIRSSIYQIKRI